jgi:hypothetical protein
VIDGLIVDWSVENMNSVGTTYMMLLGISILPKQNIQNGRMCAKNAIFLFQVFSVPSHISVSLSLIRQVAWLLGKLMVDNIIYQIKRYLCITNKRESYGVQHHM